MSGKTEIVLSIGTDGTMSIEGQGYSGPTCDKELRALAEALGTIESVEKKHEYYETAKVVSTIKTGVH